MDVNIFLEAVEKIGVDFYTGVPDSQLKALCDTLYVSRTLGKDHIVAANEGAAVGLAAGHYLAVGRPALVYMQNSGIGNAVNPIASLMNDRVYRIPAVFVVGWRGEPGVHDEPQHVFQGEITVELLELLKVKCFILSTETTPEELSRYMEETARIIAGGRSAAFVVRKGAFTAAAKAKYGNSYRMKREDALQIIAEQASPGDIFVSTTGKVSRELFEIRERLSQGHERDFLTVGSMGHASMIAMGIALAKKNRTVYCIDGDGAAVMHMGSMAVAAGTGCGNIIHIIINNNAHETVGGMPVDYGKADFQSIARAMGYSLCLRADNPDRLKLCLRQAEISDGIRLIEVMAALGSRSDLGRPTTTPLQNKEAFMKYVGDGETER